MHPADDREDPTLARDLARIFHGVDDAGMGTGGHDHEPLTADAEDECQLVCQRILNQTPRRVRDGGQGGCPPGLAMETKRLTIIRSINKT
jgi:hypothetical protein